MVYLGAWGKLIHEKNLKSKIPWHCPFKGTVQQYQTVRRMVPMEKPREGHQLLQIGGRGGGVEGGSAGVNKPANGQILWNIAD